MKWTVGVDVGGTFTDFFAFSVEHEATFVHKRPSTPHDPSEAVIDGLSELLTWNNISPQDVIFFAHGTTVATNTLIQRKGGTVAVLTTKGFRDLLEIGRQIRPSMYDLKKDQPKALVSREHRFEVRERIGFLGDVIEPLRDEEISRVVGLIEHCAVDAVAVCFLFSFILHRTTN